MTSIVLSDNNFFLDDVDFLTFSNVAHLHTQNSCMYLFHGIHGIYIIIKKKSINRDVTLKYSSLDLPVLNFKS